MTSNVNFDARPLFVTFYNFLREQSISEKSQKKIVLQQVNVEDMSQKLYPLNSILSVGINDS